MVELAARALKCDAEGAEGIEVSVVKKNGVLQPFPNGEQLEHESGDEVVTTNSLLFVSAQKMMFGGVSSTVLRIYDRTK